MRTHRWILGLLALALVAPLAGAQENQTGDNNTVNVDPVDGNGGGDTDEAVGFGVSTTVVIVLVVMAVLVVALIVAMANRP